jgi:hypothetical protein
MSTKVANKNSNSNGNGSSSSGHSKTTEESQDNTHVTNNPQTVHAVSYQPSTSPLVINFIIFLLALIIGMLLQNSNLILTRNDDSKSISSAPSSSGLVDNGPRLTEEQIKAIERFIEAQSRPPPHMEDLESWYRRMSDNIKQEMMRLESVVEESVKRNVERHHHLLEEKRIAREKESHMRKHKQDETIDEENIKKPNVKKVVIDSDRIDDETATQIKLDNQKKHVVIDPTTKNLRVEKVNDEINEKQEINRKEKELNIAKKKKEQDDIRKRKEEQANEKRRREADEREREEIRKKELEERKAREAKREQEKQQREKKVKEEPRKAATVVEDQKSKMPDEVKNFPSRKISQIKPKKMWIPIPNR